MVLATSGPVANLNAKRTHRRIVLLLVGAGLAAGCVDGAIEQSGVRTEAAVKSGAVDYLLPVHFIGPALDAVVRGAVRNLGEMK
jgi:hypothetical protein